MGERKRKKEKRREGGKEREKIIQRKGERNIKLFSSDSENIRITSHRYFIPILISFEQFFYTVLATLETFQTSREGEGVHVQYIHTNHAHVCVCVGVFTSARRSMNYVNTKTTSIYVCVCIRIHMCMYMYVSLYI